MKKSEKFANLVLGGGVLFCVTVLIYALFLSVLPPTGRMMFVIAAVAGMLLFAFALRWRPETKVNLALSVLSIAFALYLLEILILFGWADVLLNERIRAAFRSGVPFDRRSRLEVITDLRTKGIEAFPIDISHHFIKSNGLPVNGERLYPLAGVSNKSAIMCNESGEWIIYENDEHGFNNPRGMHQNHEVSIVLIGDSFTHGNCVPQGEDIGGLLREGGREVLNLGIRAFGPLEELAILKEYGEPVKPKTVLWFYYEGNDLLDLVKEAEAPLLLQYLDPEFSQELRSQQATVDQLFMDYLAVEEEKSIASARKNRTPFHVALRIAKLVDLRRALSSLISKTDNEYLEFDCGLGLPLFSEVLAEANDRVHAWGGQLYFVYLPDWWRISGKKQQENLFCRDNMLRLLEESEVPLIDFTPVMSAHPDPLSLFPFRIFGHYTAEGYQLLAEQIETYLEADSAK